MIGTIKLVNQGNAIIFDDETNKKFFIHKNNLKNSITGDEVLFSVKKFKNKIEGKVEKILNKTSREFVGTCISKEGIICIVSCKKFKKDFKIYDKENIISLNDKIKILYKKDKNEYLDGKVLEVLGQSLDHNVEMNSIILEYGFDTKFPKEVEQEAYLISEIVKVDDDRIDFRNKTTFTIDPETAKDFDDALSIEEFDNYYEIGVHIADVSHYVKANSLIDIEAKKRCTSVYLVDRTIPMLPERLSNGLCSLNPNVDRYAFSVIFKINMQGKVLDYKLQNSVINSNHRYTYEEALEVIEGKNKTDQFKKEILILNDIAKKLRLKRKDNLDLSSKEAKFKLDENNKPIDILFKEANDATMLIEDFMLLANQYISLDSYNNKKDFIWRCHDLPNDDKVEELELYLDMLGYSISLNDKEDFNKVLNDFENSPLEDTIKSMITRCMSKANYDNVNIGHYGLGFTNYSHFTSPIRRYADLIAHRILKNRMFNRNEKPVIKDICNKINNKEVQAMRAERDSIAYKQTEYMIPYLNQEFKGVISYLYNDKCYIKLENGVEGVFPLENRIENNNFILNNKQYYIGTLINVKIKECDLFNKRIILDIL